MIKTTKQILLEIVLSEIDFAGNFEKETKILKDWANSIVDECAGNFECDIVADGEPMYGEQSYKSVLMRGSILEVKNMIK